MNRETPQSDPLVMMLFTELDVVDQMLRGHLRRALPKGMELSHVSVLNLLATLSTERSPAQLARAFHVSRAAMSNTLTRLESSGYVHIRPDWDDARRKHVSITRAGIQARDQAMDAFRSTFSQVSTVLDPLEIRSTLPVLRKLRAMLEG
ncbi:MarR family winged helix-turn-helix transcriptional regulator [Paracoccaceae bacterium GXU_MW_L88]